MHNTTKKKDMVYLSIKLEKSVNQKEKTLCVFIFFKFINDIYSIRYNEIYFLSFSNKFNINI
jgi:hypothetical protein